MKMANLVECGLVGLLAAVLPRQRLEEIQLPSSLGPQFLLERLLLGSTRDVPAHCGADFASQRAAIDDAQRREFLQMIAREAHPYGNEVLLFSRDCFRSPELLLLGTTRDVPAYRDAELFSYRSTVNAGQDLEHFKVAVRHPHRKDALHIFHGISPPLGF